MLSVRNLFIVTCALTVVSCAGGPKVVEGDPFRGSRDDFLRNTQVIALADVVIPDGMPEPGPIIENFNSLISKRLIEAGFNLIYPQRHERVWSRLSEEAGGFTDSTGVRDPVAVARAMSATLTEMKASFKPDAVLVPSVVVVEAPFGGGRAVWDGTWQSIKTGSVVKGFFAGSPDGTVGALSLKFSVVRNGAIIYEKSGGIEVLSKLEGKEFVLVPRQELFTEQKRIEKAVDIVLDPLLD